MMHITERAGLGQKTSGDGEWQMVNGRRSIMEPVEAQLMTKVSREREREGPPCQSSDPG